MAFSHDSLALALVALAATSGCGAEPSFLDNTDQRGRSSAEGNPAGDETVGDTEGTDQDPAVPASPENDWTPGWASSNPADADAPPPGEGDATGAVPPPTIPEAEEGDLDALHKCLAKWKNNPFKGKVDNYQKINASVSVGGFGNLINDTERTDEPFLVLVEAGVNVGGAPIYNLLNPNGYYCIKVNVNVLTALTVNLHCHARLADQQVNVNVGSGQNDTTSTVGVHVLSNITVTPVRPAGDACIR
jgi:hypothetical protein